MDVTLRIPRMREAINITYKLIYEEQHMHSVYTVTSEVTDKAINQKVQGIGL
jgi:hypothetical protein